MLLFSLLLPLIPQEVPQELEADAKSVQVFGRFMSDFTLNDGFDGTEEGAEIRRARIGVKGDLSARASYVVEVDFGSGTYGTPAHFADAYLELKGLFPKASGLFPNSVQVGHFKEPMGLDELTSSRFNTFMERSVTSAFAPARNHGLMLSEASDEWTWQLGYFYASDPYGAGPGAYGLSASDSSSLTGRLVWRPWFEHGGKSLLHLGVAFSDRNGSRLFNFYPGSRLTGEIRPELANPATVGFEFAWTDGPWSITSEAMSAEDDLTGAVISANSIQVSRFMGDAYGSGHGHVPDQYRGYKTSSAAFGRAQGIGEGTWEVAVRVGDWDFEQASALSGSAVALGLNWYWDQYTRLMLDSTQVNTDSLGGSQNILAIRFAYDF